MSRIVVTGLGATTPLGGSVAATWSALLAGKSGVRALTESWAEALPVRVAAQLAVEPSEVMEEIELSQLDRPEQVAIIAVREAWRDAGLRPVNAGPEAPGDTVDPERTGAMFASACGGATSLLERYDAFKEKGPRRVSPNTVSNFMLNGAVGRIGLELDARAGLYAPAAACATGSVAVSLGMDMIRLGRADVVVVGGCEASIHPMTVASFAAIRAMSRRNDEPQRASRPFDKGRDGFVLAEGAAALVLESAEHAAARGARIYCELASTGTSSDAHHIVQPHPQGRGVATAITRALTEARISPEEVVHVNAHATSTPQGDAAEVKALHHALGKDTKAVVSATKSMTGHLLGAAGALEAVATVLALYHRVAPPTINLDDRDDEINIDIATEPRPLPEGPIVALNNSFGMGGHNVVLAFRSTP